MGQDEHPALAGRPVYLDYNATTPMDPRVVDVIQAALTTDFGNPSSAHAYAEGPRRRLTRAREQVAALLHAAPATVVFTASGSEADALAVRGAVLARAATVTGRPHVITQVTEHPAVLAACRHVQRWHDVDVTYLPVDRYGRINPGDVRAAITPETVLVTVMHANNETGTLQPIADIAEITRPRGILLHTDAAQGAGKVDLDVDKLGVDLLTIVGHKVYAPKGIAALYVREGVTLEPIIGGGGQERGLRAGTENVALAAALGAAADLAARGLAAGETGRLARLRDQLQAELTERLPGRVHLHGHPTLRLPNTLNIGIDDVIGRELLAAAPDVAGSTGSACHSGDDQPSASLLALGLTPGQAASALRLSLGRWTTAQQVTAAADSLTAALLTSGG
ncbi:cysteine desulfurase family protein [Blastococcus jejuensis]|uniref:Cysteine desulfurase family protein n=1 Tax=Blastococcus jejuensis TaxID=351224 RepID=A0ABP6P3D9_9ACTN